VSNLKVQRDYHQAMAVVMQRTGWSRLKTWRQQVLCIEPGKGGYVKNCLTARKWCEKKEVS